MIFRTRSIKVPLPPPDGELTTISIPCGAVMAAVFASCVCVSSFNILHLFAKFLNLSLNGQGGIFDGDFGGFRQNRVSLPIEFLEQEIQSLANFALFFKSGAELLEMAAQSNQLLADVAAIGEIGNFLGQPAGIQLDYLAAAGDEFSYSFLQSLAIRVHQTTRCIFDDWHFSFDPGDARAQFFSQR